MNTNIADIVNASQDALAARDVEKYLSFVADDVVLLDPTTPRATGRDAVRKSVEGLLALCSEIAFADRKTFIVGKSVAMRFTLRLRTVSGKEGSLEGIDVFELNDDGLIQAMTSYYDMSQLGALTGG